MFRTVVMNGLSYVILKRGPVISPGTTKLAHGHYIVDDNFNCGSTNIRSLEGSPVKVTGNFFCTNTKIRSTKGCPREIGGDFFCDYAPKLLSLHNIHKHVERIGGDLYISIPVKSHILGVLKIRDLRIVRVTFALDKQLSVAGDIINHYLFGEPNPTKRNIHKCQEELIEAGLGQFAQL